jgi:hypothetical protein
MIPRPAGPGAEASAAIVSSRMNIGMQLSAGLLAQLRAGVFTTSVAPPSFGLGNSLRSAKPQVLEAMK